MFVVYVWGYRQLSGDYKGEKASLAPPDGNKICRPALL